MGNMARADPASYKAAVYGGILLETKVRFRRMAADAPFLYGSHVLWERVGLALFGESGYPLRAREALRASEAAGTRV